MLPIVTPEEMAAVDAAAPEPVEVLIERAGAATARAAVDMLAGCYGRRVVVLAGKGNNGADGRAAARRLARRGARVAVLDAGAVQPSEPLAADLLVDAAFGTGLRRPYTPPSVANGTRVLAVDIPSGVDGLTGETHGAPLAAERTVTFGALKPGLLLHPGAGLAGRVVLDDIGLDVQASTQLVQAADATAWLPQRPADAHKWRAACWVIAGSAHMTGAARLAATAALRFGAGYVRLSTPGAEPEAVSAPVEAVSHPLPARRWERRVLAGDRQRFAALLVGPGLGRSRHTAAAVRSLAATVEVPLVLDGDALAALGTHAGQVLTQRKAPAVLTPHDGEYELLTGGRPPADRFAAVRSLASKLGAHVLLKGPTTLVAAPDGALLAVNNGDARLATAGTGDVLAGMIAGLLSAGVAPLHAAAAAAWFHGQAARRSPAGMAGRLIASDLLDALTTLPETTATTGQQDATDLG